MTRFVVLAALLGSTAAQAPPEKGAELRIFSPNPPACAAETVDNIEKLVAGSVAMIGLTKSCATSNWEDGPDEDFEARLELFGPNFHSRLLCASNIVVQIHGLADIAASMLTLVFDCFNNNQACGQSIASAMCSFLDIASSLIGASDHCAPPASDGRDPAVEGFECWHNTFAASRSLVEAAKFIDVAVTVCNPMEFMGGPDSSANGTTLDSLANGTALLQLVGPEAARFDNTADLGTSWDALQQPKPFRDSTKNFQTAPVERRLRTSGGGALGGGASAEWDLGLLGQLREQLSEFAGQLAR